jgi:hypothetical protein
VPCSLGFVAQGPTVTTVVFMTAMPVCDLGQWQFIFRALGVSVGLSLSGQGVSVVARN